MTATGQDSGQAGMTGSGSFGCSAGMTVTLFLLLSLTTAFTQPYTELVPKFNPRNSAVMVRRIDKPTLANLDFAAYHANPIRYDHEKFKPKKPDVPVKLIDITFNGRLDNVVNTIKETPLTHSEIKTPMAWAALKNHVWEKTKSDAFSNIASAIEGYKWADPSIFKAYQTITATYLHENGKDQELWVKIEFSPWVKFLKAASDEDKDGIREVYGRVSLSEVPEDKKQEVFSWITNDYLTRTLNREQMIGWAQILSSYWYPTLNTDMVEVPQGGSWPSEETEKSVRQKLKKLTIKDPTVVIRGVPLGKPIYNVFWVPEFPAAEKSEAPSITAAEKSRGVADTSLSANFLNNQARFEKEREQFGQYPDWESKLAGFRSEQTAFLAGLPKEQMGFAGKAQWLFFRRSLEYTLAGCLTDQEKKYNPLPHLLQLKRWLEKAGVNLLFVPIPPKTEVYAGHLPGKNLPKDLPVLNPWGRHLLAALQDSGIEVIDILPALLEAKKNDAAEKEALYQKHDTHWSWRGLDIAAEIVSDRLAQYSWYAAQNPDTSRFTVRDTIFSRRGDIVERLPQAEQPGYMAADLKGRMVFNGGKAYQGAKEAPILIMGDSFTGVYQLVDCKSAGVGSHIAAKSGLDTDMIISWGGGPLVRERMFRKRGGEIGQKRLVIYMMAARDMYQYSQEWETLELE